MSAKDPGSISRREFLVNSALTGGIVAYYPAKIPLHHRSQRMKETAPFGELLARISLGKKNDR